MAFQAFCPCNISVPALQSMVPLRQLVHQIRSSASDQELHRGIGNIHHCLFQAVTYEHSDFEHEESQFRSRLGDLAFDIIDIDPSDKDYREKTDNMLEELEQSIDSLKAHAVCCVGCDRLYDRFRSNLPEDVSTIQFGPWPSSADADPQQEAEAAGESGIQPPAASTLEEAEAGAEAGAQEATRNTHAHSHVCCVSNYS